MANYPNANYTVSFLQYRTENEANYLAIFADFGTDDEIEALTGMIANVWDFYEISGESYGEETMFIQQVYNQHKSYFRELLDNYKKQFDYEDGIKKVTEFTRSGSTDNNSVSVDLPNKKIDAEDIYKYPDTGDKGHTESESGGETTVTDYGAFLELKRAYLDQIRNVFEEFAYRFSDCFLHLY